MMRNLYPLGCSFPSRRVCRNTNLSVVIEMGADMDHKLMLALAMTLAISLLMGLQPQPGAQKPSRYTFGILPTTSTHFST